MALPDFFPKTDPVFDIGGPNGLLLVGQPFDRSFNFTALDSSTCGQVPVDFTGFTLHGESQLNSNCWNQFVLMKDYRPGRNT